MHYLANTSYIKTQTVTDTSLALRVGSAHPSHRWTPGTSLGGASKCSDTTKETYSRNAGIATGLAFTDRENNIFFRKLLTVSNAEELRNLCDERTKVERLRRNILLSCEKNLSCARKSWNRTRSWSQEKMERLNALRTARRALLRCDSATFERYHGSLTIKRLNRELYLHTNHHGYYNGNNS